MELMAQLRTGVAVWIAASAAVTGVFYFCAPAKADDEVRIVYAKPKTAKLELIANVLQQQRLLEVMAAGTKAHVALPGTLTLVAQECGQSNAFYNPRSRSIHMCYELVQEIFDGASREFRGRGPTDSPGQIAAGALLFVFLHELGHAMVQILNVPYFGKQEDVADQIATYFALTSRDTNASVAMILGGHWFFRNKGSPYVRAHLADTHSLGQQRQFNVACWAYGSNPQRYVTVAQYARLPQSRAARCPGEYRDLDRAVRQLLGSYLRGEAARTVDRGIPPSVGSLSVPPGKEPANLKAALAQYLKGSQESLGTTQRRSAFVDLNGDESPDALVFLESPEWCGSGGCALLVFQSVDKEYRLIGHITLANLPILVSERNANGWRDLIVSGPTGQPAERKPFKIRFDGTTYGKPGDSPSGSGVQFAGADGKPVLEVIR